MKSNRPRRQAQQNMWESTEQDLVEDHKKKLMFYSMAKGKAQTMYTYHKRLQWQYYVWQNNSQRKMERANSWTFKVKKLNRLKFNTPSQGTLQPIKK